MRPHSLFLIAASAARAARKPPLRLTASTRSHSSEDDIFDERQGEYAGVLDENVEAAELRQRRLDRPLRILFLGNVGPDKSDTTLAQRLCRGSSLRFLPIRDHHPRVFFDEAQGDAAADAAGRADDESHAPCEPTGHARP